MRRLRSALLALALAVGGPAFAQVTVDPAGLRVLAAQALVEGDSARAAELAQALLARDPDDVVALVVLARARLAAGDPEGAIAPARRAHALGEGEARYASARVIAAAHTQREEFNRAQLWLRIARRDAPDERAVAATARDYRAVAARNPLRVSLAFGLEPTSNINGGSTAESITLPGLPFEFVLDGEARALSGLRYEIATQLSYRLTESRNAATFIEAQLSGRTYTLSDEAREQAPDAKGSDYADVTATASLIRRWGPSEGVLAGPGSLGLSLGQTWYDGDPYLRFAQVSYERFLALGPRDQFALTQFVEWTSRLQTDEAHPGIGLRGRWSRQLRTRDVLATTVTLRSQLTEIPDVGYDGATLGLDFGRADPLPLLGARLSLGAELDWRRYDASIYSFDPRHDLRTTLRASLGFTRLDLYGFHPSLDIEASRTKSDVGLFDREALSVGFGLRSSF